MGSRQLLPLSLWYHYNISMKSIHIRNVPPEILAALKRRAASHRRSLQGELLAILDRAAKLAPPETLEDLDLHFVETGVSQSITRDDIYEDHR